MSYVYGRKTPYIFKFSLSYVHSQLQNNVTFSLLALYEMLLTLVRVVIFCHMKHLAKYANICAFQGSDA